MPKSSTAASIACTIAFFRLAESLAPELRGRAQRRVAFELQAAGAGPRAFVIAPHYRPSAASRGRVR